MFRITTLLPALGCFLLFCGKSPQNGVFCQLWGMGTDNATQQKVPTRNNSGTRHCPCENADLCKPIPARSIAKKEVYGFATNTKKEVYLKYDWSKLTSLAMWEFTDELMCYAHSKGVRLDLVVSEIPKDKLTDPEWRKTYIQQKVDIITNGFLDGLNYDPEYGIALGSPERQALVDLVNETRLALKKVLPDSKVSFDAAWASFCVDDRCYDYKGLSDAADWLFIMSYDIQGQIWGPDCIAMSNTPYDKMVDGISGYLSLGISPEKMVLGLPWYGYDYPCVSLSDKDICEIPRATYHGAPCSDLVGNQKQFDEIMILMENSTNGRQWNLDGEAPQFNYKNATGHIRQVHYDDPQSLVLRYLFAVSNNMHGVGFWHVGCMTNMETPEKSALRKQMWDLVPSAASWDRYVAEHQSNATAKLSRHR
ncbi:di-N-acetylchitobiase-like isoform X2 [Paramacrobiotus metropolitanus]|uniref:di-N-acetylchitobiase-like isoform X2 n=1 Tax=Paramacrobiotus metropolitanus TaxID=2943436 RepID=UPI002445CB16|nr:di-N-acetylchitobiase-like isoform X2 [Paramacrobiotus metropolitanus]